MFIGLNGSIDIGGHFCPISTLGEILLWKNAQKNERKNMISEIINMIIPICSPFDTSIMWFPWFLVSRDTSRHHAILVMINITTIISSILSFFVFIHRIRVSTIISALFEARMGHGLFSTIWNT